MDFNNSLPGTLFYLRKPLHRDPYDPTHPANARFEIFYNTYSVEPISHLKSVDLSLLDQEFDFVSILGITKQVSPNFNAGCRYMNIFNKMGISNYRGIIEYIKNYDEDKLFFSVHNGVRNAFHKFGCGDKINKILYTHLYSLGIEIFEGGYKPSELFLNELIKY